MKIHHNYHNNTMKCKRAFTATNIMNIIRNKIAPNEDRKRAISGQRHSSVTIPTKISLKKMNKN